MTCTSAQQLKTLVLLLLASFNGQPHSEIYTLSLHDALPICDVAIRRRYDWLRRNGPDLPVRPCPEAWTAGYVAAGVEDRKSTRLNSSHANISYAVFCLKKKREIMPTFSPACDARRKRWSLSP